MLRDKAAQHRLTTKLAAMSLARLFALLQKFDLFNHW